MTKTCTSCHLTKPIEEFSKRPESHDGYRNDCKACRNAHMRVYGAGHKTEIRAKNVRYRTANKTANKARLAAYHRTPNGWASNRWGRLNRRTVNGSCPNWKHRPDRYYLSKGVRLEMARDEFDAWVARNWQTALGIWARGGIPSIDRRDTNGHYCIGNMQIIPLRENCDKARSYAASKRVARPSATVSQKSEDVSSDY